VAPGSTVAFGTTGTAALFESQVISLPGVAQGMARVVSNSGDLLCNALVLDASVTPPGSTSALAGFVPGCGDNILQAGEQCDGASDAACPGACGGDCLCPGICGDGFVQAGETCDDGNLVGGDCCDASCQLECNDANPCTADTCNPSNGACTNVAAPRTSCLEAGKSAFQLKQGSTDSRNQIKWKWSAGPQVLYGGLGSPDSTDTYSMCVFDSTSGVASVATLLQLPPSSLWTTRPATSWAYADKTAAVDGISSLKLSAGVAGRSKMQMKAAGAAIPMPTPAGPTTTFALQPSLVVQLTNDRTSACWKSTFSAASVNDGIGFKAKRP
jgi:cysteine-rich repeat protein